jgi:hypothetical protein
MRLTLRILALALPATFLYAFDGVPVRGSAADYPARAAIGPMTIAAAYVPRDQVKKLFGADLFEHGYVVLEVAVFPEPGREVDLSPDDFYLRQGFKPDAWPGATPHMVALQFRPQTNLPMTMPATANVGSRGSIPSNERDGGRMVSVGARSCGPGCASEVPLSPKLAALEKRLSEQSFPKTKTSRPVAGYLFFPRATWEKKPAYELRYFGLYLDAHFPLSPVK